MTIRLCTFCMLMWCTSLLATDTDLASIDDSAIGKLMVYIQESDAELSATEAFKAFTQSQNNSSYIPQVINSSAISFGIGTKPI